LHSEVPKTCTSAKISRSILFTIIVFSNIYASKTLHNTCFDLDTKCGHENTGVLHLSFSSSSSKRWVCEFETGLIPCNRAAQHAARGPHQARLLVLCGPRKVYFPSAECVIMLSSS
jgi:hypothetical protein